MDQTNLDFRQLYALSKIAPHMQEMEQLFYKLIVTLDISPEEGEEIIKINIRENEDFKMWSIDKNKIGSSIGMISTVNKWIENILPKVLDGTITYEQLKMK